MDGIGVCGTAPGSDGVEDDTRVDLRILATTDLHFQMWPHEYSSGREIEGTGLISTVSTITTLRAAAQNALLVDNGDLLQGNALADLIARDVLRDRMLRTPVHQVLTAIGYDAVALGNHDLNYGIDYLMRVVRTAPIPWLCANLFRIDRAGWHHPLVPGHVVLEREVFDIHDRRQTLRIGLLAVMPPQSADWDRHILGPDIVTPDPVAAAAEARNALIREGADIVIALCHSGLATTSEGSTENAAAAIAALDGIDAVIAGHTHDRFPGPDFGGIEGYDVVNGKVHGTPLVLPGSHGAMVGLIDLRLARRGNRWRPVSGFGRIVPTSGRNHYAGEAALAPLRPSHLKVLGHSFHEVGATEGPLYSHFALIGTDPVGRLLGQALLRYGSAEPLPERWRDLPMLAATSPIRAGGRLGPSSYISIEQGAVLRGHLSDIYPYPNTACLVGLTGAGVRAWLEESARFYNRVDKGAEGGPDDLLFQTDDAPYLFDTIWGLRYAIDPSRDGDRIRRLSLPDGTPVADDDRFVMVTNSYRAAGGGSFEMARDGELLRVGQATVQSILHVHLSETGPVVPDYRPAFDLEVEGGALVRFPTGLGHENASLLAEDRRLRATADAIDGFDILQLEL